MTDPLHGNCHCGRFRFELMVAGSSAALEHLETLICPCSLCKKKGCLWLRSPPGAFAVTRDEGSLVEYQGTKFCGSCGTVVLGEHRVGPLKGQMLVNMRAVWGFDPFKVEAGSTTRVEEASSPEDYDGRNLDRLVVNPSAAPAKHLGSCHCGKVRVELLIEISDLQAKEDNCSSCVRNAYIGIYSTKDQVRVHGREHTFEYTYGRKFNGAAHCKTCGVGVFNNVYGPPLSVFDRVPPERKEQVMAAYWKNMALQPLNVRALDDVDADKLSVERTDEGTEGYALSP